MPETIEQLREVRGTVFDVKRFAIHDGPGIRTTVFLKGCNMTCWWCHNPESKRAEPQLFLYATRCTSCGRCVEVCPVGAHRIEGGAHTIDRARCRLCGACVTACPAGALKIVGQSRTAGEVIDEVLEDKHYYETSGGGMTISGGEPLCQAGFTHALLSLARHYGLHTCLDTNAGVDMASANGMLELVDLFLVDIKQTDPARCPEQCGVSFERIRSGLDRLARGGGKIVLRCPVIPTVNAEDDGHWSAVAELAAGCDRVVGVEYLPYHRLWISKMEGLGLRVDEARRGLTEIRADRLARIHELLGRCGKSVAKG
ncbi:MAG: glycyl-radical enzyme activating protein [Phycisphaerae bacterium]|nr:glycyl-radical enzyme activating protein [Phycisphaerae bacterium]